MATLLDIGKQCTTCDTVDFLPITCQHCLKPFCSSHIHNHACAQSSSSSTTLSSIRGPQRPRCQVHDCREPTMESASNVGGSEDAIGIRCQSCGGAFCITHRSQDSHSCSAPRPRDEYHISLAERQVFARETLAKAFPAQAGRVIPKPPPARNIVRDPPVDVPGDTLPPVPPQRITAASRVPASKADKLRALTVRKMKSLAKPVDVKMANTPMEDRRYFTWEVDESGEQLGNWNALTAVEKEDTIGKQLTGGGKEKAEQLWAPSTMSAGRVLDLLAKQARLRHIHDPTDASQNLGLVALSNPPLAPATTPRSWQRLDLSKTLSSQIEDCVRLLVVRGA